MEFYTSPPVDPVDAANAAATATEGSRGSFNPSVLRQAFKLFLLNFSAEGDFPYKAAIKRLPLLAPIGGEFSEDGVPVNNGGALSLVIELEHLAMPEWLGRDDTRDNDDLTSEDGTSNKLNEILIGAFRSYPLRSVTIGEDVIREVYLDLLPVQEREKLQREHGNDSWAQIRAILMAEKHPTHRLQQLQLELKVEGKPLRIRDLTAATVETLVIIHGIVIQAYRPYHKAVRLFVKCRGCSHQLTLAVPAWKGQAELPLNCVAQGGAGERCPPNPYMIIPEMSQFVDTQTIKIQEFPEDVPSGDMARTLMLNCSNSLAGRLIPGDHVRVVGVHSTSNGARKGGNDQRSYVHVLGTEPAHGGGIKERAGAKAWWDFKEEEEFQAMAKDTNILNRIFQSIAPALIGLDDIKKSVACLLFGGTRKTLPDGAKLRGDVNVLLLGDPSTAKSQFLKFVEHAAPIAVYTSGKGSSAAGLTAAVVRDSNGNFALEGGAMVLADGGAVCIDEFDKMRPDDRVAIHEAMEQQTISLAKAGITAMLSSRCSVLAAANPVFGSYDITKDTTEQHDFETTILSRFDLIWIVKDDKDPAKDATISQHIFNLHANISSQAVQLADQNIIPLEKLKRYIRYCRSTCHPVLTSAAAKKLENFYLEVRSAARSDTRKRRDQIPITVRQLESLVRISESLAKMSLTTSVNESHVEEAIRLFKLSTVEAAKTVHISESLSDEQKEAVKRVEAQILSRLPPGARTSKITVLRDLQHRGFSQLVIVSALKALVARGALEERGDASIRRVN